MIVEDELDPVGDVCENIHDEEEDEGEGGVVTHQPHLPNSLQLCL